MDLDIGNCAGYSEFARATGQGKAAGGWKIKTNLSL